LTAWACSASRAYQTGIQCSQPGDACPKNRQHSILHLWGSPRLRASRWAQVSARDLQPGQIPHRHPALSAGVCHGAAQCCHSPQPSSFVGQAGHAVKASGEALLQLPERSSHCMEGCQPKMITPGGIRPTRTPLQCASGDLGPSSEIPCSRPSCCTCALSC